MRMGVCNSCQKEVARTALCCPHCRYVKKYYFGYLIKVVFWIAFLSVSIVVLLFLHIVIGMVMFLLSLFMFPKITILPIYKKWYQ